MGCIRRRTGNKAVGEDTRFEEDLHLNETVRRLMFSFMMETFTARGVNLPAKGCFVSTFMPCATPGDVLAIVRRAFGHTAPARPAAPPAPVPPPPVADPMPAIAAAAAPAPVVEPIETLTGPETSLAPTV